jgi:hypothetical protein
MVEQFLAASQRGDIALLTAQLVQDVDRRPAITPSEP